MSAYKDSLVIDDASSEQRLELAGALLAACESTVTLDGVVHVRASTDRLTCEVVDPAPSNRRCAAEFEVMVENARRALAASKLQRYLPARPQDWLVVEDYGMGALELWPRPNNSLERGRER